MVLSMSTHRAVKDSPDATVYLTKDGTRVRLTKGKQFPIDLRLPIWMQQIRREANERLDVIRISDGHVLCGCTKEDLIPE